jgi:PAS domain-containing protein
MMTSIAGITNFRDITNQINIELKLKQREQRFQALIENNEGIISLVNRDKKSLFRTASAKRLTGWTDEEFDSIPESELYTLTAYFIGRRQSIKY